VENESHVIPAYLPRCFPSLTHLSLVINRDCDATAMSLLLTLPALTDLHVIVRLYHRLLPTAITQLSILPTLARSLRSLKIHNFELTSIWLQFLLPLSSLTHLTWYHAKSPGHESTIDISNHYIKQIWPLLPHRHAITIRAPALVLTRTVKLLSSPLLTKSITTTPTISNSNNTDMKRSVVPSSSSESPTAANNSGHQNGLHLRINGFTLSMLELWLRDPELVPSSMTLVYPPSAKHTQRQEYGKEERRPFEDLLKKHNITIINDD
jgi:hypothetical protein